MCAEKSKLNTNPVKFIGDIERLVFMMLEKMKKKSIEKKNMLIKHSGAVHISNEITLVERKIYNVLLKNAYHSLLSKKEQSIRLLDIAQQIGWEEGSSVSQYFRDSIIKLVETSIQWNVLSKDKKNEWGISTLLASAVIKDGVVYYTYSERLKKLFFTPNIYTTLDLELQKLLKSKHSLALWEFCCEQLDTKRSAYVETDFFDINMLKKIFGINEAVYADFKEFNKYVLKPSIAEINSVTDIHITLDLKKSGRVVTGMLFKINRRIVIDQQYDLFEDCPDALNIVEKKVEIDNLLGQAAKLKLSIEIVESFLKDYDVKKVLQAINLVIDRIKKDKNIDNVVGYIWKVLDSDLCIEDTDSNNLRKHILLIEDEKKTSTKQSLMDRIDLYIEQETHELRKIILKTCKAIVPKSSFLEDLERGYLKITRCDKCENNPNKVLIDIEIEYALCIGGFEADVRSSIQREFRRLGMHAEVVFKHKVH